MLFGDSDFVAYPRVSPDGKRLAWMAWDHPNMPWDDTRLYVADLGADGLANVELVAGGGAEIGDGAADGAPTGRSTSSPTAPASGTSTCAAAARRRRSCPQDAEFAGPLWGLGQSNYVLLAGGRIVASYGDADGDHLVVIDEAGGPVREIALPFTVHRRAPPARRRTRSPCWPARGPRPAR